MGSRSENVGRVSRLGVPLAVAMVVTACGPAGAENIATTTTPQVATSSPSPPPSALSSEATGAVIVEPEPPPLLFPDDAGLVNVKTYGAAGDGISDDTAALERAIAENVGRHRILYFPPGTYLVRDSLEWRDDAGNWQPYLTLQGAGKAHTSIRLADRTQGFSDVGVPKGVIVTASGLMLDDPYSGGKDYPQRGEGNQAFRNYIFDLTVETGVENPGAVGIDFLGNNISGVENVAIRSEDLSGRAGLSMTRRWPGPSLIKNVEIVGFDYGIEAARTEYGITFEDIVLRDQQVAGIRNAGNVLSLHRLDSTNQVPAIQNESSVGLVVLIDAELRGGAATWPAIENAGAVYLRSITTEGYATVLNGLDATEIDEYSAPTTDTLGGHSLALPIEDPPPVDRFLPLEGWTSVTDPTHAGGADPTDTQDDTAAIQAALDSGAPVVYFPSSGAPWEGRYLVTSTLVIPGHVARIVGFESLILGARATVFTDANAAKAVFRIDGNPTAGLQVESLRLTRQDEPLVGAIWFDHRSPRSVTLRHVQAGGGSPLAYRGNDDTGRVFLEDVCCGALALSGEQEVWARQLNVENPASPMVENSGAQLWVLGIKTEAPFTIIETTRGGTTELVGGLLYPAEAVPANTPAFVNNGATTSLVYAVSAYVDESYDYQLHVADPRGRLTEDETVTRNLGSLVPLYKTG